jgi:hypothetical protein
MLYVHRNFDKTGLKKILYRWAWLFAVDTSCYFGPRILNSQIKRPRISRFTYILQNLKKAKKWQNDQQIIFFLDNCFKKVNGNPGEKWKQQGAPNILCHRKEVLVFLFGHMLWFDDYRNKNLLFFGRT